MTKEEQLRKIVKDHQYAEIENQVVDVITANMMCTIIDGLSSKNKEKYLSMPIERMAEIGWRLVS